MKSRLLLTCVTVLGCAVSRGGEAHPETCDGRWAVEVTNGLHKTIDVLLRTERFSVYYEAGEFRVLGEVLDRDVKVFYPRERSYPQVMVRTQDDLYPVRLDEDSPVVVRIYCEQ